MSGVDRIAEAFASADAEGRRAALMPYLMGGFPDLGTSRRIGLAYADAGADLIELGVPFSDPLADGPVVHAAGTAALMAGATVEGVLEVGRAIAERVPVIVMCYANPIFLRGIERFADALVDAAVCGLIVPDLPLEEGGELESACELRGIALVQLVAPTTPEDRMARIASSARGFIYTVARTGTTGERASLDGGVAAVLARVRAHAEVPVAVGFGISDPDQAAAAVTAGAEGVIIGSRLVRAAAEAPDPVEAVTSLVRAFGEALH
ncbi:MAG TPA: tryptophan synthase subunit alpha [Solirubrobacteraceae bacterium]